MTKLALHETGVVAGVWRGILSGVEGETPPALVALRQGSVVDGLSMQSMDGAGNWQVCLPIPAAALGTRPEAIVIAEAAGGTVLAGFTVGAASADEPAGLLGDLAVEVALLRAELELVKRVLRGRHGAQDAPRRDAEADGGADVAAPGVAAPGVAAKAPAPGRRNGGDGGRDASGATGAAPRPTPRRPGPSA